MTEPQYCQRSDLMGTQIITRSSGKRLGVVSQLWVDVDRREVVAVGMRESVLSGVLSNIQQAMLLTSVRQIGDVVLVDDNITMEDDFNAEAYSTLINSEVITETGELLGKVRGFKFDTADGRVEAIVVASIGLPQIPDQLISTYELSMQEVVSSGPDRLIVFEGAEEKLSQLTVGLLERIGIGKPPWERDDEIDYATPTKTENQLPSGVRVPVEPLQQRVPVAQETWDDDNWEREQREVSPPLKTMRQEQSEASNWDDDSYEPAVPYADIPQAKLVSDEDVTKDAWEDDENPQPRQTPVNIPERKRVVEYEEETDY
ncbi:MAG: PRC-barrel domain-containing protein [Pegethrix bostrychoides GSE-TBD4-15B]|jgi:sporulation protein YlmC with PRC-barrel domain|uniref:PRC-barrel domain-containing protein n=1 Tax=Pegethrix bostrychoides GSE-TBD4-15B TaxID=2839662 RepID=A0A951PF74_9CYAN|nr:PRC-barrel domain-containing protein [Pegethrix bostrychoides GSE-TBD4-15B]